MHSRTASPPTPSLTSYIISWHALADTLQLDDLHEICMRKVCRGVWQVGALDLLVVPIYILNLVGLRTFC